MNYISMKTISFGADSFGGTGKGEIDTLMEQCGYAASIPNLKNMILDSYEKTKDMTAYSGLPNPDYSMMFAPEIENPPITAFSFRGQFDLVAVP